MYITFITNEHDGELFSSVLFYSDGRRVELYEELERDDDGNYVAEVEDGEIYGVTVDFVATDDDGRNYRPSFDVLVDDEYTVDALNTAPAVEVAKPDEGQNQIVKVRDGNQDFWISIA